MTPDDLAKSLKQLTTEELLKLQLMYREGYREQGPRHFLVDMLEAIQAELDSREAKPKEQL
jgi:hypothetical protein